jgi:hypothetical protein
MGCIFCGGEPLTREHVLPRWLRTAVVKKAGATLTHRDVREGRTIRRDARELDFVVRVVCRSCNEGWMHRLEEETRPILTPLAQSRTRIRLDAAACRTLALWTTKTAAVAEHTTRHVALRPRDCEAMMRSLTPPRHALVWLACQSYAKAQSFTVIRARTPSLSVRLPGSRLPDTVSAASATFRVGYLVLQTVIPWVRLPWDRARDDRRFVVQIWPPPPDGASWPPAGQLQGEEDFDRFAGIFTDDRIAERLRSAL